MHLWSKLSLGWFEVDMY
ncbi:hypothetical protein RDABS01_019241 [Bienertia sinuspersici]